MRALVFFLTLVITWAVVPQQAHAAETFTQTSKIVFLTDAAAGQVGNVYSDKLVVYTDSSVYKSANMSAHDGKLDIKLNGVDGVAFFFRPTPTTRGQQYGKFTVKFRATGGDGNGGAFLLWPNSGHWNDGEIDYPEGKFGTLTRPDGSVPRMKRFHHVSGANCPISAQYPYGDCHASYGYDTGQNFNETHTTGIEWTPTEVRYYLDGVKVGSTVTTDIPVGDHRFTIQTGPTAPPNTDGGHLYIYAATVYKLVQ